MGKRHLRHHDDVFDDSLLSGGFDDVDYDALFDSTDWRATRQKRLRAKSARNRFDDYEQDKWLAREIDDWDDLDIDADPGFDDDN